MIKTILAQLKEFKLPSLLTPLCMIGEVLCEMIIPILMGKIVDNGIYGGDLGYIVRTGIMMIVIAVLGLFSGLGGAYFGSKASAGLARNLRKAMYDNIQTYSFANIDKFSTSGLVTRLTTDVTNIQNAYMMLLRMAMRAPASMIVAMIMSFIISPQLASVYLIAVVFLGVVMLLVMNSATKYFKAVFEKYDALNESVQENVSAIRVVKAYVREDHEISKFQKAANNIYLMFVKAESTVVKISPIMMGTVYVCILLISWLGAHMIVGGSLTTGELMSMLTYCQNILMSLMMLSMIFVMITMSEASAKRIAEVINEETSLKNPENPIFDVKDGSISFEHVDFAYKSDSKEPVLKDINIDIRSGETIGIIGGTGSAKSSLVNLISRLYDVTKGSLKVGGVDVRDYDMESLRNQVSVVLQKNVLFSGTIYENLRWGNKEATDEECKRAAELACADEFIKELPDGYDTYIEQGGTNVSGGQRQRLCIARALLKKPKILILDDSTSAVDTATDAKIRKAFANDIPDTTKIIIAQRISSVQSCDRIIVMDEGKINGFGTHEELLANNPIYREVYESQTGSSADADFDEKN
ncbi:ABC transporter ATP-binding protein [Butyrivibrio sp.]|uniref:ABC transporter ATP-binding protein n=1 Tax=Butyrivibrio sp. TaxID=28121 RepID=UPI0025C35EF3|nr:ABC transporter ATP-binding protein [Butyrivibrio sp.]MBQ9305188.1 ABC transporter ATP-binding protein [Butyrivibrio sp.]